MKNKHEHAHLREEKIDSTQVFDGKLLKVRLDRSRLPDGSEARRLFEQATTLALGSVGQAAPPPPQNAGLTAAMETHGQEGTGE